MRRDIAPWVRSELRRARIEFRSARQTDDQMLKVAGHAGGGARVKFAIRRLEEISSAVIERIRQAIADGAAPGSHDQLAGEVFGVVNEMAESVRSIARKVAADSPDALLRTEQLLVEAQAALTAAFRSVPRPEPKNAPVERKKRRVSDAELRRWLIGFADVQPLATMDIDREVHPAAVAYFFRNVVTRKQMRQTVQQLCPGRVPGRKAKCAENSRRVSGST